MLAAGTVLFCAVTAHAQPTPPVPAFFPPEPIRPLTLDDLTFFPPGLIQPPGDGGGAGGGDGDGDIPLN